MTCCVDDCRLDLKVPMPWRRLAVGLFVAAQTMVLGLTINLAAPEDPSVRLALQWGMLVAAGVVVCTLAGALPGEAMRALRRGRITLELLFVVSLAGAGALSIRSMVTGHGPVYFDVIAVVSIVQAVGRLIAQASRNSAAADLSQLAAIDVPVQRIGLDGQPEQIAAREVRIGDRIRVPAGGQIAVDGVIESGRSLVRQTALTGEWIAVPRGAGDVVLAGSVAEDGMLVIVASAHGTEREIDRLVALIGSARQMPTHLQRQVDRWMRWFVPAVVLIAISATAWWWHRSGVDAAMLSGLSILLVACPCGIGLATPLAVWQAMGHLARRGLMVRGGDVIERLAQIRCVIFDKTGTLSMPAMKLQKLQWCEDPAAMEKIQSMGGQKRLINMLAGIATQSNHPICRAMESCCLEELAGQSIAMPADAKAIAGGAGMAISPEQADAIQRLPVGGLDARFGPLSLTMVRDVDTSPDGSVNITNQLNATNHPSGQVALAGNMGLGVRLEAGGVCIGRLVFAEPLRQSAHPAMVELIGMKVPVCLMTGDTHESAMRLAAGLPAGAVQIMAGLSGRDKHAASREFAKNVGVGKALFVGDGINDAAAMASAHASIAISEGAAITLDTAGGTLHGGDLRAIPKALLIARQTMARVRQNLIFSLVYNITGIVLAAMGWLHPVIAAVLMAASSALVSWRSLNLGQRFEAMEIDAISDLSDDAEAASAGRNVASSSVQVSPNNVNIATADMHVSHDDGDAASVDVLAANVCVISAAVKNGTGPIIASHGPGNGTGPIVGGDNWTCPVFYSSAGNEAPLASRSADDQVLPDREAQRFLTGQRQVAGSGSIALHLVGWIIQGAILLVMFRPGWIAGAALMMLCAAVGLIAGWQDARMSRAMRMIWLMLSYGGLGMVLGWWADMGWSTGPAAAMMPACCQLLHPDHGMMMTGSAGIDASSTHWMYWGMLLLGVPAMYLRRAGDPKFSLKQWCCVGPLVIGVPAMCGGMWMGSLLAMQMMRGDTSTDPLMHWILMMVGMAAGMSLCHLRELLGMQTARRLSETL